MPIIKIMNWNIQNLGPLKFKMDDILEAIAKVVVLNEIDIVIFLEINTTDVNTASQILLKIMGECNRLANHVHGVATNYTTGVLSPGTGVEFYGFIVKNINEVAPAVATNLPLGTPVIGGDPAMNLSLADCTFDTRGTGGTLIYNGFPLYEPDLAAAVPRHLAHWTGTRLPCLALFRLYLGGVFYYLPILTCHFAANEPQASAQIRTLLYFSLLDKVAHPDFRLSIDGRRKLIEYGIVTGDFNISPPSAAYGPLSGAAGGLGFQQVINANTHLVTYNDFNPREIHDTPELATACYDNFFIDNNLNALLGASSTVDIPGLIRSHDREQVLYLNQSVKYYADLDQKGFAGCGEYEEWAGNFAAQIRQRNWNRDSEINIEAALVGARLISDHLPVIMELNFP